MPVTRRALFIRGTITRASSYWRGSRLASSFPQSVILTENDEPILTEIGDYIETGS